MRQALSLVLTLAVIGAFFPTIVPKIETVFGAFLDLALQLIAAGSHFAGA